MKKDHSHLIKRAREIIGIETEAVRRQKRHLDSRFAGAVDMISSCTGRVVVIGIGKSGLVGRKLAATLSSTGTPALFLHPVEGLHGDLGMVEEQDIILALSYSGETEEIRRMLTFIRSKGLKIIAMTGKLNSPLADKADVVIPVTVLREACPYNVTPTASTTAMLAMGDALAITLMEKHGLKREDVARLHPGGNLGKRLLLKVKDLMHKGGENPIIREDKTVRDALFVMTRTRLGATSVVDRKGRLVGFFTDGDLRRMLQKDPHLLEKKLSGVMTRNPISIHPDQQAMEAAILLEKRRIDNLPVLDPKTRRPIGVLDERDLLAEGIS